MATFHFDLVSPEAIAFSGEVDQVDIPGTEGDFGVLADHAPTVATIRPGILTVKADGKETRVVVLGGFAEVSASGLTVLADVAQTAEDFDRGILARQIAQLEADIARTEPGDVLDRLIARLDHFKSVDQNLHGTAMH
jgi:F-type H+-transporting ATPase subunit epsilon